MHKYLSKILTFLLFACIFALCIFKIQGYDVWFHLETGKYILSTGAIPYSDPFSYTAQLPWIAHSWLAGVVFFVIAGISGLSGLILFNALIISLYLFFVFYISKQNSGVLSSVLFVFIGALAIRGAERFFIRPDVFTLFFISLYLLLFYIYKNKCSKALFFIPLSQILWANLHGGGSIVGIGMVSMFLAGETLDLILKKNGLKSIIADNSIREILIISLLSCLAIFINPFGWKVPFYFTHTMGSEFKALLEWRPLTLSDLLGPFGFILAASILSAIMFFKKIKLTDIMFLGFFAIFSMRAIRLVPMAVIAAIPIASFGFAKCMDIFIEKTKINKTSFLNIMGYVLIIILLMTTFAKLHNQTFGSAYSPGFGLNKPYYPIEAVKFINDNNLSGKMFNNYGFGGFLIWNYYPARKVFIDGRFDIFGEDFAATYRRFPFKNVWDFLTKKYNFSFAILDNEPNYICKSLDLDPEWVPVFWDDRSVIYVKDNKENKDIITTFAYTYLKPNNRDLRYLDELIFTENTRKKVLSEIMRSYSAEHVPFNASLMLAYVYERSDQPDDLLSAIAELKRIIAVFPGYKSIYSRIGILYLRLGKADLAETYLKKAGIDLNNIRGK